MITEKGNDAFDSKIEALYLQRKNSIHAPDISLNEQPVKKSYRVSGVFSILTFGAVASFGILAVINHFAHLPSNSPELLVDAMTYVKTIEVEKIDQTNQTIHMQPPIKDIQKLNTLAAKPTRDFEANTKIELRPQAAKAITINSLKLKKIALVPNLTEHQIAQPTFKVMPKITKSLMNHQAGKIKLAYKVTQTGKVENITIIESNVHKSIERAAKKALSQWRYAKQQTNEEDLQVEFQFSNVQ